MEIVWDATDRAGWTARQDGAGCAPFQQSWDYGEAARRMGATVRRALLCNGGREVALAQVLDRHGVRLILRGPVWLGPVNRRRALRCLARGLTIATPEEPLAGFGLVPLVTGRFHAVWDIGAEPAVLRAGLDAKWAGRLGGAKRAGLRATPGLGALDALIAAEAAQRRDRGYRSLPPAFTGALPRQSLRVWHWRHGGRVRAAMAFVRHGSWATYHLGWAEGEARTMGVHQAMLWQAALALRAEGVGWLDLGWVDTEAAPGLARFKLGTGAGLRQLGATAMVLPQWRGRER